MSWCEVSRTARRGSAGLDVSCARRLSRPVGVQLLALLLVVLAVARFAVVRTPEPANT